MHDHDDPNILQVDLRETGAPGIPDLVPIIMRSLDVLVSETKPH